jgi:hypothetical protein
MRVNLAKKKKEKQKFIKTPNMSQIDNKYFDQKF